MVERPPSVTRQPAPGFLARVAARIVGGTTKAQGAPEGQTIAQPVARVQVPDNGWLPMSWGIGWWQRGFNVLPSGENSVVDACVWAYVRAIAQLPGYHREKKPSNEIVDITTSALSRLLRFPNTYETRSDFLTHTVRSLLYDGNSYWLAMRNDRKEVASLHWLNPAQCRAYVAEGTGEIFYSIGNNPVIEGDLAVDRAERWLVPARDILHIKLATPRDPLVGETWLTSLALDLLNRGAMNLNMAAFFQNMSRPSGVLATDQILTKEQVEELRQRWNEHSTGMNSGGVPILTAGLKWNAVSMNATDSQLIEALKLNDRSIAGVFGVPGILIGIQDTTAWNSTEALMNYWLSNGLGYLLDHIETAIDQFFALPANQFTEFDTNALLRTAFKDRIEALARGVQGTIFAPNEARAREGLKKVKDGDEPRAQQQLVPLSFASQTPIPSAPPAGGQPSQPALPPPDENEEPEPDEAAEEEDEKTLGNVIRALITHRTSEERHRG